RHVALKFVKSGPMSTETVLDKIKHLQRPILAPVRYSSLPSPCRHIPGLLDRFKNVGPNGTHVCIVSEVYDGNLLGLIRRYRVRITTNVLSPQVPRIWSSTGARLRTLDNEF
ncbi:hypothetical protein M422DRAFT_166790, partial [Sphaerobolus stellatus SS14]